MFLIIRFALFACRNGFVLEEEGNALMKEQLNITMLCAVLALSGACLGGCGMQGGSLAKPSDTNCEPDPSDG